MNSADFLKIKNNEYFCPNHPDESTGHNDNDRLTAFDLGQPG